MHMRRKWGSCLWDQEEQECLAEVPQDASNCNGHACKVCVCVPHKHLQNRPHPRWLSFHTKTLSANSITVWRARPGTMPGLPMHCNARPCTWKWHIDTDLRWIPIEEQQGQRHIRQRQHEEQGKQVPIPQTWLHPCMCTPGG